MVNGDHGDAFTAMPSRKRLIPIPKSGIYFSRSIMSMSNSALNVVGKGNIRDLKHMDSSAPPKRPTLDRRWHTSQSIIFNTPSDVGPSRPSQDISPVIHKGSIRRKDRFDNRIFDREFTPQFEEVEWPSQGPLSRPKCSSKTRGLSRTASKDHEVPISETNHIQLFRGLDDKNGLDKSGFSLITTSPFPCGPLGISPTHPLGHQPASFFSVSDVPKPVYTLSEIPLQPLEALNPLASTDRVNIHEDSGQLEDVEASKESLHGPLGFRIPRARLEKIRQASLKGMKNFWQYTLYQGPKGEKVKVHYCQSKEASERIARLFLDQEVIGFDIEWKPHASANDGIRKNVALVQLAGEERIALFHIARYSTGDAPEDLVAPSLQKIMESPDITKAGVAIKADCTRLRRHMRIDSRGLLELSHLYKQVNFSTGDVKKIDKKLVTLAQQVEEHLNLPLWKGEVRTSDWTEELDYKQIEYAASDSYAALQLFYTLEGKRKALSPSPPRPKHAELNLPIPLANNEIISTDDGPLEVSDEDPSAPSSGILPSIEEMASEFLNVAIEGSAASEPSLKKLKTKPVQSSTSDHRPEFTAANDWIMQWRATLSSFYKPRAMPAQLRAYALWHEQQLSVNSAALILRDPPLKKATVAVYILESLTRERLPFQRRRITEVVECLPPLLKARYEGFLKRTEIEA